MPNWCVIGDVQARLTYETISAGSQPNTTQVTAWLDEAEAILRGALRAIGATSTYTLGTDGATQLGMLAVEYATGRTKIAWASAAGDGTNEDGENMVAYFRERVEDIIRRPSVWSAALDAGGSTASDALFIRSNYSDGTDSYQDPVFKVEDLDGAF